MGFDPVSIAAAASFAESADGVAAMLPTLSSVASYAGMATTAVGALTGAAGQRQAAAAQAQAAQYQAQIARMNQQIANQNASTAIQTGEAQTMQQQLTARKVIGAQTAAQGASGLDINSGSAVNVRASSEELASLDAMNIQNQAQRSAWNFKTEGVQHGAQAELESQQAQYAKKAGQIGSLSSLLGGASTVGDEYMRYKLMVG